MANSNWAMSVGPALARLRRSTAYGVLGLAAIAIAGCTDNRPEGRKLTKKGEAGISAEVLIWSDPETTCEYLIYDRKSGSAGMGGITPRLDAQGEPMCAEGK